MFQFVQFFCLFMLNFFNCLGMCNLHNTVLVHCHATSSFSLRVKSVLANFCLTCDTLPEPVKMKVSGPMERGMRPREIS